MKLLSENSGTHRPADLPCKPRQLINIHSNISPNNQGGTCWHRGNFQKYLPNSAFDYAFADEEFALLYKADQNFLQLAFIFSGLSILISILGLVGLTMFMINRRRKEIGIRKVMGASVPGITVLISKEFFKLVIVAIIIAIPAGWWVMNNWLQDHQYRITLSWPIFALASLIGMLAAIFTLRMQAVRAAMANPAESLKTE